VRERRPRGQHQVGERGERVLVGTGVERLPLGLLRGDERRRPGDHREPRRHLHRLAEAEVGHHGPDAPVDCPEEHVGGLEVAVQHASLVQRLQPGADLADHLEHLRGPQPVDLEPVGESPLVGVRHHQVGPPVVELAGVVHRHDVRRLHPAQEAPLLEEPLPHGQVLAPVLGEHLDRDGRVEVLVVRQPDGRERARADASAHGVATETSGHGHDGIITAAAAESGVLPREDSGSGQG
jgi:hypothetical protein